MRIPCLLALLTLAACAPRTVADARRLEGRPFTEVKDRCGELICRTSDWLSDGVPVERWVFKGPITDQDGHRHSCLVVCVRHRDQVVSLAYPADSIPLP